MATSTARVALRCVFVLALLGATPVAAECPDAQPLETIEGGGVGGTGHTPEAGGVGGTGHTEHEGGIGGSGHTEGGGVGGTGVLATLRDDASADATMCIAGYRLATTASTQVVSSETQLSQAADTALRAGALVWAVGAIDGDRFEATQIEILASQSVSLQKRVAAAAVSRVILELPRVEAIGSGRLRAAGVEVEATRDIVARVREAPDAPLRIRARRGADGGLRATRLEVLAARPRLERAVPAPHPPAPAPLPESGPRGQPAPTPTDRPPRVPKSELTPPPRVAPERPPRPEIPVRPERPARPELPDLPPRPEIDRVGPANG